MYKLFSSLTGKIMEDPKDGELVEKGKLSAPTGKTVDHLISNWRGKADIRTQKELDQTYVLMLFYLAYKNYGVEITDIKKLGKEELIELRNRILPICRKISMRWKIWTWVSWLLLSSFFIGNILGIPLNILSFVVVGIILLNFYVFMFASVSKLYDFRLKFLKLHEKLTANLGEGYFPEGYKDAFKYYETRFKNLDMDYLRRELRQR